MVDYVKIGNAPEATFGASGAPDSYVGLNVTNFEENIDRSTIFEETIDNRLQNYAAYSGLKVSGSLDMNLRKNQIDNLIYSLMGAVNSDNYTFDDPATFRLSVGDATRSSTKQREYYGFVVNSAEFTFETKEFVKCSFDWIAQYYSDDGTYSAPSYDTTVGPIVFHNARIFKGSTQITTAKSLSLTIDRKIDDELFVLGDYKLNSVAATGAIEASGTITFTESEWQEMARTKYGDTTGETLTDDQSSTYTMYIKCYDVYTDAPGSPEIVFTLNNVIYNTLTETSDGKAQVEKSIDYNVYGDISIDFDPGA